MCPLWAPGFQLTIYGAPTAICSRKINIRDLLYSAWLTANTLMAYSLVVSQNNSMHASDGRRSCSTQSSRYAPLGGLPCPIPHWGLLEGSVPKSSPTQSWLKLLWVLQSFLGCYFPSCTVNVTFRVPTFCWVRSSVELESDVQGYREQTNTMWFVVFIVDESS